MEDDDNFDWESSSNNTSSNDDDEVEMLRPDSYVKDDTSNGDGEDSDFNSDSEEEEIERPTTIPGQSSGGYGDGHFDDDDDYGFDDGEEVSF